MLKQSLIDQVCVDSLVASRTLDEALKIHRGQQEAQFFEMLNQSLIDQVCVDSLVASRTLDEAMKLQWCLQYSESLWGS